MVGVTKLTSNSQAGNLAVCMAAMICVSRSSNSSVHSRRTCTTCGGSGAGRSAVGQGRRCRCAPGRRRRLRSRGGRGGGRGQGGEKGDPVRGLLLCQLRIDGFKVGCESPWLPIRPNLPTERCLHVDIHAVLDILRQGLEVGKDLALPCDACCLMVLRQPLDLVPHSLLAALHLLHHLVAQRPEDGEQLGPRLLEACRLVIQISLQRGDADG
mmetsp:Transcript_139354/g.347423  ORF Transcript_139354/g.347423 Transcript_139354/m.347423 type:complete len:212 (+) Transcript_139354:431-1066(+)